MNIKKFTEYSLKENVENTEDKIEDTKDAHNDVASPSEDNLPFDSDLNEVGDEEKDNTESNDSELSDYTDFSSYENKPVAKNEAVDAPVIGGSKIVIINGCEPDSEIDKKTEEFKSKCGGDCKEIYLYQLNIQSPKKQEPKDGMLQVYDAIENADAIILACQVNKGKLSDSLETAIARIKNYYKKEELKNKIFGAIVVGNEEKVKNDLILTALNDFHMVVCADCLCFCNDKSSTNLKKMIDSITTLSNATALIKTNSVVDDTKTSDIDDIKPYDEFIDSAQTEEPNDKGLPEDIEKEEGDAYVNTLKNLSNISLDDTSDDEKENDEDVDDEDVDNEEISEDDNTSEEEERLIDNQNGTITQIHKGEKVTENKDLNILSFDKFFKK